MTINTTKLFFVVLVIVVIFALYLKNRFTPQYANKIWKWVDEHMQATKEKLFSSMPKLREDLNRDLKILEIGSGGGMNFRYYPEGTQVTCVDPDPEAKKFLEENIKQFQNRKITLSDYICGKAEKMSQFADDSFDAVVCTLVLCAVDNPEEVVKEVKRVLKPKVGVFYFAENVFASIGDGTRVIQKVAEPIWPRLFYGCHLLRDSGEIIREAGFKICKITRFDLHIPSPLMAPMRSAIYGTASK